MSGRHGHAVHQHAGVCDCGKRIWPDRKTARKVARIIPAGGDRPRAYRCLDHPDRWHIGHLPEAVQRGEIDRDAYRAVLPGGAR